MRAELALVVGLVGCGAAPVGGETTETSGGAASSGTDTGGAPTSGGNDGTETGSGATSASDAGVTSDGGSSGGSTTGEPAAGLRYDQVRQKSAHNSFQRDEGLIDMIVVHRVRSLELDIHVGKTLEPDVGGDWYVYHTDVVDADSQCRLLSQCLAQVAAVVEALPEHEAITLWVDLKDGFGGGHQPADLDARLLAAFGPRLVTPGELVAACAGATTVQAAVTTAGCGWPELAALRGRVIVALTGGDAALAAYVGADAAARAAFVAPALTAEAIAGRPEAAFVNLAAGDVEVATAVGAAGLVSRVWVLDDADAWAAAVTAGAHHLATNRVNVGEDPWSTTAGAMGWPFECIDECEPPAQEPGQVLAVTVDSGDLWNENDEGVLVRWPLAAGALTLTAYLAATSSHVEPYLKNCVGVRAGDAADAAYFAVCRPADEHRLRVQVRASAGGATEAIELPAIDGLAAELPGFVKVERDAGGLCARGFGSADGVAWIEIAAQCFASPLDAVGVMASSHDAGEARVLAVGLTATPGGPLRAGEATVVGLGAGVGSVADGL